MRLSGQPASLGARCQGWGTAGHLGDGREHASDVHLPVGPLLHTPRCQCQHGLPTPPLWSLVLKWPQALLTPVSSSPEGPAQSPPCLAGLLSHGRTAGGRCAYRLACGLFSSRSDPFSPFKRGK